MYYWVLLKQCNQQGPISSTWPVSCAWRLWEESHSGMSLRDIKRNFFGLRDWSSALWCVISKWRRNLHSFVCARFLSSDATRDPKKRKPSICSMKTFNMRSLGELNTISKTKHFTCSSALAWLFFLSFCCSDTPGIIWISCRRGHSRSLMIGSHLTSPCKFWTFFDLNALDALRPDSIIWEEKLYTVANDR